MKFAKQYNIIFFLCLFVISLQAQDKQKLHHTDGPYISLKEDGREIMRVSQKGISRERYTDLTQPFSVQSHSGEIIFDVKLHTPRTPEWKSTQSGDILILSDPHGNLEAFVSILNAQNVIDDNYKWVFGQNHLVVIGDVFDRGDDVLPIFWLIYKLEEEARKAGGKVHFLYGNHEDLILRNDVRYMNEKYKHLTDELKTDYSKLWLSGSELGYWLKNRNTIEIIGNNLFVHAGLSKEFLDQNWDIAQVNEIVRKYIGVERKERDKSEKAKFLFGSNGPIWYRGMVHREEKYNPIAENDVDAILKKYNMNQIFVGHTIFEEITSFYQGKVIDVNVNNKKNWQQGRSRGILIKGKKKYLVYDDPSKNEELK